MAWEDVPVAEALDLVATLPDGSLAAAAIRPERAWGPLSEAAASVVDAVWAAAVWQGGGVTQSEAMERAPRVMRPQERERRRREAEEARRRAASVRDRIENTRWEEDDG